MRNKENYACTVPVTLPLEQCRKSPFQWVLYFLPLQMEKNKGLTARKKKELRHPRIKHRMKYRKAKIRRRGQVSNNSTADYCSLGPIPVVDERALVCLRKFDGFLLAQKLPQSQFCVGFISEKCSGKDQNSRAVKKSLPIGFEIIGCPPCSCPN